jgi:soluble lytic murein transglycosylase
VNLNDFTSAIKRFKGVFQTSSSDYYKSRANYLMGETYLKMGLPDQAYARFQESLVTYPGYIETYNGLVILVRAGIPVNEFYRGLVNYYVGQYGLAIDAFTRFSNANPQHDGSVHHYRALALRAQNFAAQAIEEWQTLIDKYPNNRFYTTAWGEIAYTQWINLNRIDVATNTYLRFVEKNPTSPKAPDYLYTAARLYERNNRLLDAAATWELVMNNYPAAANSQRALFLSGISYYRLNDFSKAQVTFQRCLLLASTLEDKAAANLWIGKILQVTGKPTEAIAAWEQAYQVDPTGYYSERARELYQGKSPFSTSAPYDLGYDLNKELPLAEAWLRAYFSIPSSSDLLTPGPLANEGRFKRGTALWQLGQFEAAKNEFESLRVDLAGDAGSTFRLVNHLIRLGLYRSAILGARQVLDLANMSDATTLSAPVFFTHTRFGLYYRDYVVNSAQTEKFHPLFLYSVIRQESLFEGFAKSGAGAKGLMQIMPATGKEIAAQIKWPEKYTEDDLNRPFINIRMGTSYLARWRDYFNGDLYAALAAYNGGPGNTIAWKELAPNDPDLFLEVIRADESRQYIMRIFEFFQINRLIYERIP